MRRGQSTPVRVKREQRRKNPSQKLKPPATISKNDWRLHIVSQPVSAPLKIWAVTAIWNEKWEAFCWVTLRITHDLLWTGETSVSITAYYQRTSHVHIVFGPTHARDWLAIEIWTRVLPHFSIIEQFLMFAAYLHGHTCVAHPKSRSELQNKPRHNTAASLHDLVYI